MFFNSGCTKRMLVILTLKLVQIQMLIPERKILFHEFSLKGNRSWKFYKLNKVLTFDLGNIKQSFKRLILSVFKFQQMIYFQLNLFIFFSLSILKKSNSATPSINDFFFHNKKTTAHINIKIGDIKKCLINHTEADSFKIEELF